MILHHCYLFKLENEVAIVEQTKLNMHKTHASSYSVQCQTAKCAYLMSVAIYVCGVQKYIRKYFYTSITFVANYLFMLQLTCNLF